jgi:hypothetical protein
MSVHSHSSSGRPHPLTRFMTATPKLGEAGEVAAIPAGKPETTRALGSGNRFHYWRGKSGRRYLFSAVPEEALKDLSSVVVLFADGEPADPRAAWVGEIDGFGRPRGRALAELRERAVAFVHFLARNDAERRAVLDDLTCAA